VKCLACKHKNPAGGLCAGCKRALPERSVGEVLGDHRIVAVIAQGFTGCVYKAMNTKRERLEALKVLPQAHNDDPARIGFFFAEAKAAARITHESVVQVLEVCEGEENYFVMELLPGERLRLIVEREGHLSTVRALNVGSRVASALIAAHEVGVVHGSVNADNIFVDGGARGTVKLCAFGIPPEQGVERSRSGDVHALGTLMLEILGSTDVPEPIMRLVHGCLAKSLVDRPGLADVDTILRHQLASLQLLNPGEDAPVKRTMPRRRLAFLGAGVLVLVAVLVVSLVTREEPPPAVVAVQEPVAPEPSVVPEPEAAPSVVAAPSAPAQTKKERVKKGAKSKGKRKKH
jgi:serine/threonine protein kinase